MKVHDNLKCLNGYGLALPLFILGTIGVCGFVPASLLGGAAIAFSVGMALSNCTAIGLTGYNQTQDEQLDGVTAKVVYAEDVKDLIGAVVIGALGVLTVTGILPGMALGLCIIAKSTLSCMVECCAESGWGLTKIGDLDMERERAASREYEVAMQRVAPECMTRQR